MNRGQSSRSDSVPSQSSCCRKMGPSPSPKEFTTSAPVRNEDIIMPELSQIEN